MSTIRLSCNICPKKPHFCDISHLLTHVASKGHLSHYFKLQVRSRQEPAIRAQLDAYDEWYDDNQLERLLSERMVLKESKKSNKRQGPRSQPRSKTTVPPPPLRLSRRSSKLTGSEDVLDPRLTRAHVKLERPTLTHHLSPHMDPGSRHRAYVPRMGNASIISNYGEGLHNSHGTFTDSDDDMDDIRSPIRQISGTSYPDPSTITHLPSTLCIDPHSHQFEKSDNGSSPRSSPYKYPLYEDHDSFKEEAKLKGILWPGMSLFDSASSEARRKRNQRKDNCVLDQMSHDSAMIEAIESIYFLDGTLKKHRPITGMVESSPLKEESSFVEESPIPKRRPKVSSAALRDLSTNVPKNVSRAQRTSFGRRKGLVKESSGKLSTQAEAALTFMDDKPRTRHNTPQDIFGLPDDNDVEWGLTYANDGLTNKRGFSVFNDEIEDEQQKQPEAQSVTEQVLRHYSSLQIGTRPRPSASGPRNTVGVVECPRPMFSRYHPPRVPQPSGRGNQENMLPIMDHNGRIDGEAGPLHGQRSTQRYFSIYGTQPPQFFDALPSHMDFGSFGPSRSYRPTANPLNLSLQRHRVQSNPPHISGPSTPDTARSQTPEQKQNRSYHFVDEDYF